MTALNLSASDSAAVAFYEEMRNYVDGFGLVNLDREDRLQFKNCLLYTSPSPRD